jgi:N-acetylmuramoyl-L-alanine amidase
MWWKLRVLWYRTDKAPLVAALIFSLVVGALVGAAMSVFNYRDAQAAAVHAFHAKSLECLARNVYYEARGETQAGQYAVAEVTMNRRASPRYPKTICAVVYQKNWDPLRGRWVGAFSWTEFDTLDEPVGPEWQRAVSIAEEVYYQKRAPAMPGVTHFHATYVQPEWSKELERVARIGRHVFYK